MKRKKRPLIPIKIKDLGEWCRFAIFQRVRERSILYRMWPSVTTRNKIAKVCRYTRSTNKKSVDLLLSIAVREWWDFCFFKTERDRRILGVCNWARASRKKRKARRYMTARLSCNRRRPTLPGRVQPSTISAEGLNFCVRNENRWDPFAITTGMVEYALHTHNCTVFFSMISSSIVFKTTNKPSTY